MRHISCDRCKQEITQPVTEIGLTGDDENEFFKKIWFNVTVCIDQNPVPVDFCSGCLIDMLKESVDFQHNKMRRQENAEIVSSNL